MQRDRLAERAEMLFNLSLDDAMLDRLMFFGEQMLEWNAHQANLTGITDPDEVEIKHFLDSLSLLTLDIEPQSQVADVGSGAGFPGLVLKIVRPDLHVTLIESVGKKTAFLNHIVRELELDGIEVLKSRAESVGQDQAHRERYDLVVARAVAHMPVLAEYLLPLCRIGGRCVAMKGASALAEMQEAEAAIMTFGGSFGTMHNIPLPDIDQPHIVVVMNKIRMTPTAFPRREGIPTKRPILAEA